MSTPVNGASKQAILSSYRNMLRVLKSEAGLSRFDKSSTRQFIKDIYLGVRPMAEILPLKPSTVSIEEINEAPAEPSTTSKKRGRKSKKKTESTKEAHFELPHSDIEYAFRQYIGAVANQRYLMDKYNIGKKEDLRKEVQNIARRVGLDAAPVYRKEDKTIFGRESKLDENETIVGKKTIIRSTELREGELDLRAELQKMQRMRIEKAQNAEEDDDDDDFIAYVGFGDSRSVAIEEGILQSQRKAGVEPADPVEEAAAAAAKKK